MKEKVLWATKKGSPSWQEQVICTKEKYFEAAISWAKANGFNKFRVAVIDISTPPKFEKTLNTYKLH